MNRLLPGLLAAAFLGQPSAATACLHHINHVLAILKHAASWNHKQWSFLAGQGVRLMVMQVDGTIKQAIAPSGHRNYTGGMSGATPSDQELATRADRQAIQTLYERHSRPCWPI